jgi:hypothetical protein
LEGVARDELDVIEGRRDELEGVIQKRYSSEKTRPAPLSTAGSALPERETIMYSAKDYDQALLTPESVFGDPMKVVDTDSLTPEQKLAVLKRWEANATDLEVAANESMTSAAVTDGSSRLCDVGKAILALTDRETLDDNNMVQVASTRT